MGLIVRGVDRPRVDVDAEVEVDGVADSNLMLYSQYGLFLLRVDYTFMGLIGFFHSYLREQSSPESLQSGGVVPVVIRVILRV